MNWKINLYDTSVTPTDEMRRAMLECEVGDDVYGEDPTVNELEKQAARLVGKESALFVPSGTMGNLIGMMVQTNHGDEVILEEESHIYYYETGGLCAVAGLVPNLVHGERGVLIPERIKEKIRKTNNHYPRTKLCCIENTHNRAGGTITSPEIMRELRILLNHHGIRMHLDGARIFNSAVALDRPVTDFTNEVDTVMFCLSKGLGAPVGSILAGENKVIDEARRIRKMLGGGMRRAGFLASAALIAMKDGIVRLKEDHRLTKKLAIALKQIDGIQIDLEQVQTNMILIDTSPSNISASEMKDLLQKKGINVSARPPFIIRLVIHKNIREDQLAEIVGAIEEIVNKK